VTGHLSEGALWVKDVFFPIAKTIINPDSIPNPYVRTNAHSD